MTDKIVQKARMKSFCLILGFGVVAALFIYYISDSLGCDQIKIDLSNATSIQLTKQYQQTCYSMDSNGKILSYLIPFVGLAFWFMIDTKVRKLSKEIDESIKRQAGKCFNCGKNIENDVEATLEPNSHCYCGRCDASLFPRENSK